MPKVSVHILRALACSAVATSLLAAGAGSAAAAQAQSVEAFYKGKQISFVVGFGPGTYEIYARLASNYLSRFIPGHPVVVIKYMPGVASIKAANYLYAQAEKDGTNIGMINQTVALEQVLKNPAVAYDAGKFTWIGRMNPVTQFTVVWHTSPVKTIQDAMTRTTILGATSPRSNTETMHKLMNSMAGTKFKIVLGYSGTTEALLAMQRGEVEATTATAEDLVKGKADWVREKKISVLVQHGSERDRAFPDIPAIGELGTTAEEKQILKLYGSTSFIGRAIMSPPSLPADRAKALRDAFHAMVVDPEFLNTAKKRGLDIDPMDGDELQRLVQSSLSVTPEVAARAQKARE